MLLDDLLDFVNVYEKINDTASDNFQNTKGNVKEEFYVVRG